MNYNISFNICGITILLILYVILRTLYVMKSKSNLIFRYFVILCIFSGLLDTISAITIDNVTLVPIWLNTLINTIYMYTAFFASFFGMIYVFSIVKLNSKKHQIADFSVIVFYSLLLIINLFTGIIFDFQNHIYNKGPFFYFSFGVSFYFILHMASILILKRKSFSKKQLILFSSFIILPLIFSSIQILIPKCLLTVFSTAITALIMLFALETPDFVELAYLRKNLENEVLKQTEKAIEKQKQIEKMSFEIVEALVQAIDARDDYTRGHSVRVSKYSVMIAKALNWNDEKIEKLQRASLLHDIGKIGIRDNILNKPSQLTKAEFEIIKQHTTIGAEILNKVTSIPFAEFVAKSHHERFDGNGYPEGLKGKEIPEFARIVNIADSYDAMSTKRIYRDKLSRDEILKRLKECRGTQFDPDFLDVFLNLLNNKII